MDSRAFQSGADDLENLLDLLWDRSVYPNYIYCSEKSRQCLKDVGIPF